jgi:hypothetical protein
MLSRGPDTAVVALLMVSVPSPQFPYKETSDQVVQDVTRAVNRDHHFDELVKALEEIAQAKMPGQARSIAHATLSKIKAEAAE